VLEGTNRTAAAADAPPLPSLTKKGKHNIPCSGGVPPPNIFGPIQFFFLYRQINSSGMITFIGRVKLYETGNRAAIGEFTLPVVKKWCCCLISRGGSPNVTRNLIPSVVQARIPVAEIQRSSVVKLPSSR